MTDMKPAITAEEWEDAQGYWLQGAFSAGFRDRGRLQISLPTSEDRDDLDPDDRHQLAALALYGQPFGFTREDVAAIREARGPLDGRCSHFGADEQFDYGSLADRIEALLPPKEAAKP